MTRFRIVPTIIAIAFVFLFTTDCLAQAQDRARLEKELDSLIEQLKEKTKQLLLPSAEDQSAFAEFLTQPDTGLIRLLPRERYESRLPARSGGSYYSFTRRTHEYGYGSDIALEQNQFSVGFAGADYGFITSLGNTSLESVNLDEAGVQFLATYVPPTKEPEVREQQRRSGYGFETGGITYKRTISAVDKTTYVLRSISYDRSDVLVAFRVVRQDSDGSLVLLWKVLKKFVAPQLVRE